MIDMVLAASSGLCCSRSSVPAARRQLSDPEGGFQEPYTFLHTF
jgi:hypothetical protein